MDRLKVVYPSLTVDVDKAGTDLRVKIATTASGGPFSLIATVSISRPDVTSVAHRAAVEPSLDRLTVRWRWLERYPLPRLSRVSAH